MENAVVECAINMVGTATQYWPYNLPHSIYDHFAFYGFFFEKKKKVFSNFFEINAFAMERMGEPGNFFFI